MQLRFEFRSLTGVEETYGYEEGNGAEESYKKNFNEKIYRKESLSEEVRPQQNSCEEDCNEKDSGEEDRSQIQPFRQQKC